MKARTCFPIALSSRDLGSIIADWLVKRSRKPSSINSAVSFSRAMNRELLMGGVTPKLQSEVMYICNPLFKVVLYVHMPGSVWGFLLAGGVR